MTAGRPPGTTLRASPECLSLRHTRAHQRRNLRTEQLDRAHHRAMRHAHQIDEVARVAEDLVLEEDLLRDRLRIADEQRAARPAQRVELRTRRRRPATLA